jgi:pimeloyl-ACP methyl ester carboxylesterase
MWRSFAVSVEGGTLCGEARGETPALCFIHGMGGSRRSWDRILTELPEDLPLVRYDLRGFGESEAAEGATFSHADDLLALLDAEGIAQTCLVGLSMGGGVALNFALSHAERVSRLVLVSPAMVGWGWSDEWKALWRAVAQAARAGDMALARERWWNHPMFAVVRQTEAADELRREIEGYHGRQWMRDDQRDELPDVDRLHELAMATLLITGERDVPDLRLIADVIEGAAPDVRRIDYSEAGHMLTLERPREVAQAIVEFIQS